ncbi:MAG: hypothetical protein [Enterobacter phage ENC7]|nr:MAG: hypothetical protein [Enterobacter phage ENC7]UIW11843.1 MAG: hypothetical protein [Enterobacter phage ENC25]UIW12101.1 MAG: hypothetical protein [Enterobacter phage ENC22]
MVDNSDLNKALLAVTATPKVSIDEAIEYEKEKSKTDCPECAERHKKQHIRLVELREFQIKNKFSEIIVLCVCYFVFSFLIGAAFAKWVL